jgi:hypothetical protein
LILLTVFNFFHLQKYWELGVEQEYKNLGKFEKSALAPIEHLFDNHECCREWYKEKSKESQRKDAGNAVLVHQNKAWQAL